MGKRVTEICTDCGSKLEAGVRICIFCGHQNSLEKEDENSNNSQYLNSVVQSVMSSKNPIDLKLAFTVDRTGSSNAFRNGIARALEIILTALDSKITNLSINLQSHGDLDYEEKEILLAQNAQIDEVLREANSIVFEGGGDAEETHLDAVKHLADTIPWKYGKGAKNALVLVCNAESKLLRSGKTPEELGQELVDKDILVFAVCEPTPIIERFINAASGILIPISDEVTESEFQTVCNKLTASIIASVSQNPGTVIAQ